MARRFLGAWPTRTDDGATKGYVDQRWSPVRLATTVGESHTYTIVSGSVTTITTALAAILIDNVAPAVGDPILIKDAPATSGATAVNNSVNPANGVYLVTAVSAQSITVARRIDMNSSASSPVGAEITVMGGNSAAGSQWVCSTPTTGAVTYGTTAIGFTMSGPSFAFLRTWRNKLSMAALGDSAVVGVSPMDTANGYVDSHIGGSGGHATSDMLFAGNLLADSAFDIIGSASIAGQTAQQIKDKLLQTIIAARPGYCFCWTLVFNDLLAAGTATATPFQTAETILQALLNAGITPILATALPASNSTNTGLTQAEVHRYNVWVAKMSAKYGNLPVWDFYKVLVDPVSANSTYGTYKATYAQTDNLHPSGVATWAANSMAYIVRDWILKTVNAAAQQTKSSMLQWQSGTGSMTDMAWQHVNPLMAVGGTANTPSGWTVTAGAPTLALAAPSGGNVVYPGNEWSITTTSTTAAQAVGTPVTFTAGDEWELEFYFGVTVTTAQTWFIALNDQGGTQRAQWGNASTSNNLVMGNVPQGKIFRQRGIVITGAGITQLYPYIIISGTAGAKVQLGEFKLHNVTQANIGSLAA